METTMSVETEPVVVEFKWQKEWLGEDVKFEGSVRGVYFPGEEVVVWQRPGTKKFRATPLTYADTKYNVAVGLVGKVRRSLNPIVAKSLCAASVNAVSGLDTFEKICEEFLVTAITAPE